MAFPREPGKVFISDPATGHKAFNAYGLPIEVYSAALKAIAKLYGKHYVRNARAQDNLPPGAWHVLIPAAQLEGLAAPAAAETANKEE